MGSLAFFPWLIIREPIALKELELLQYKRRKTPAPKVPANQQTIDEVLEPYWIYRNHSVQEAVILRLPPHGVLDDLSDKEVTDAFEYAELISFAALAARNYFVTEYWNRDNLQFTIQRFQDPAAGSYVETRTRHGANGQFLSKKYLLVAKPVHVPTNTVEIDVQLLRVLIAERSSSTWTRLYEALRVFNLANTDSSSIRQETELVLINGAFERTLETGGKESDLAPRFTAALKPEKDLQPSACKRFATNPNAPKQFKAPTVLRDVWIRDFFRLRNDLAHGKLDPTYPAIWNLREHLLLASFVFPLLLKSLLQDEGKYTLTEQDQLHIDAFEDLACAEHFVQQSNQWSFPWNKIISRIDQRKRIAQFIKDYRAAMRGA